MICNELVSLETAKLAKEKGFNEYVNAFYAEDCNTPHSQGPEKWNNYEGRYAAPTQSLLQRWLREEKGICVSAIAYTTFATKNKLCFGWIVKHNSDGFSIKTIESDDVFSTYELTLEDALKYALENLV